MLTVFQAPPSPTTPTTNADETSAATGEGAQTTQAPDTPPKTPSRQSPNAETSDVPEPPSPDENDSPESQIEKLKAKLVRVHEQLSQANRVVQSQNDALDALEHDSKELRTDFQTKEAALTEEKKKLEDHMVSIVVQQVKEAREMERNAVKDECEQQFTTKLVGHRSITLLDHHNF